MALMATDLPDPVEPAMSTCGIEERSAVTMRPLMSLPIARVRRERGLGEGFRFEHVAQMDGFALVVGNLDADRAFAGHALDENALGAHREAEVFSEAGNAAVLDAGFGLELVGGHHGAGVDLDYLAGDVEFRAFFNQDAGLIAEGVFADNLRARAGVQKRAWRQLEAADVFGGHGDGAFINIRPLVNGYFRGAMRLGWCGGGRGVTRAGAGRISTTLLCGGAGAAATGAGVGGGGVTLAGGFAACGVWVVVADSATVRSQVLVRREGMGSLSDKAAALLKAGISSTGSGSGCAVFAAEEGREPAHARGRRLRVRLGRAGDGTGKETLGGSGLILFLIAFFEIALALGALFTPVPPTIAPGHKADPAVFES